MHVELKGIFLSLIMISCIMLNGQVEDHIPGEAIIQLKENTINRSLSYELSPTLSKKYSIDRALYPELGIYLLRYDPSENLNDALRELSNQEDILYVQKNQKVSPRNTKPNDPFYIDQWYHNTIESEAAWDVTTGGEDAKGREIVIAVLDSGFDVDHEDFASNVWINEDEIPNDFIDNDNNGYVDDYYGWNPNAQNDIHNNTGQATLHGTNVAGIAGAKGNNDAGVTGVAWDVKMLLLSGLDSSAEIIEASRYVANTRKEFNSSDGSKGAYIVSSNISLGIRNGKAEDFPIWCNLYDVMGENGVLNVAAVDNLDSDVDINGDMPTTCDSEYLITVTNTDINNLKDSQAAFGSASVDIGAPGTGNVTTSPNNNYNSVSGTSVSAPLVAGAVALLYSAPCLSIAEQSLSEPSAIALTMRNMIFSGAQLSTSLSGITTQGSVLNVYESIRALDRNCASNGSSDNFVSIFPNPIVGNQDLLVDYVSNSSEGVSFIQIFDTKGALILDKEVDRTFFGANRVSIPMKNALSTGVYIVSLILPDNTAITEKLVVINQ